MFSLLALSFYCDVYKKNPNIRIFINEQFIDEYDIESHKDENLKPYLKVYKLSIPAYPLNLSIKLEIKNNDSNYNNGFMTKSTLLKFYTFHLVNVIDVNNLENIVNMLYNRKSYELTPFNLIPYTGWINRENLYIENPSHLYIGNSGTFTCHLIRYHNNFKPISLLKDHDKINSKYGHTISFRAKKP